MDGGFSYGNGNRQKIGFLPIEHFVEFSVLFEFFFRKSQGFKHLPVHSLGIDGCGILLLRKVIFEIELNVFYLLLIVGILLVLQHCFEICHTLFHIVSKHLVQAKMFGVVELFEEILHEVLQESISAIEFKEVALIGFFGRGCLEFPLFIDV